jgi:hypothetical protein
LLSVNWIPGAAPAIGQHDPGTIVRLFDSAVVVALSQVAAAFEVPPVSVWTTTVDPVLNTARLPSPLPKTLNSDVVQNRYSSIALL